MLRLLLFHAKKLLTGRHPAKTLPTTEKSKHTKSSCLASQGAPWHLPREPTRSRISNSSLHRFARQATHGSHREVGSTQDPNSRQQGLFIPIPCHGIWMDSLQYWLCMQRAIFKLSSQKQGSVVRFANAGIDSESPHMEEGTMSPRPTEYVQASGGGTVTMRDRGPPSPSPSPSPRGSYVKRNGRDSTPEASRVDRGEAGLRRNAHFEPDYLFQACSLSCLAG